MNKVFHDLSRISIVSVTLGRTLLKFPFYVVSVALPVIERDIDIGGVSFCPSVCLTLVLNDLSVGKKNLGGYNRSQLEKLLGPKGTRMMPPPGLQIYPRPRVTWTFELLVSKVDRFTPLPR